MKSANRQVAVEYDPVQSPITLEVVVLVGLNVDIAVVVVVVVVDDDDELVSTVDVIFTVVFTRADVIVVTKVDVDMVVVVVVVLFAMINYSRIEKNVFFL